MISSSREANYKTPKEEERSEGKKISKGSWSRLKDPRIVRVSRGFGGKDRHSKVCTVRGLRDRRVRLSVPTAIQLYDLQHRLGLNQPSKVVDWLLNVAKHEIDKLPPLPGNLIHQPIVSATETAPDINKESWTKGKQDEDLGHGSTTNFFHQYNIQNPSWDPWSNLSLSSHTEDNLHHNFNVVPLILPSTSLSGSQFVVYPPVGDYDPTKQMINFQMLSSTQTSPFSNLPFTPPLYTTVPQPMRPFQITTNPYSVPNKDN